MPLKGKQPSIDVDAIKKESIDHSKDIFVIDELEERPDHRISIRRKPREEIVKANSSKLSFVEIQKPINTLRPRETSMNCKSSPLPISSEGPFASSSQSKHTSNYQSIWDLAQIKSNHSPPAITTNQVKNVDKCLKRSKSFLIGQSLNIDVDEGENDAHHLLDS